MRCRTTLAVLCFLMLLPAVNSYADTEPATIEYDQETVNPIVWKRYTPGTEFTPVLFSNDYDTVEAAPHYGIPPEDQSMYILRIAENINVIEVRNMEEDFFLYTPDKRLRSPVQVNYRSEVDWDFESVDFIYYSEELYPLEDLIFVCNNTGYSIADSFEVITSDFENDYEIEDALEPVLMTLEDVSSPEELITLVTQENMECLDADPVFDGRLFFAVFTANPNDMDENILSETSGADSDFHSIPKEDLSAGMEDADTIVVIYRKPWYVGYYSSGGNAYRIHTRVVVIDAHTGEIYEPYDAVVNDPPETVYGGLGTGGVGEYEPETALEQIAARLGSP